MGGSHDERMCRCLTVLGRFEALDGGGFNQSMKLTCFGILIHREMPRLHLNNFTELLGHLLSHPSSARGRGRKMLSGCGRALLK